MGYTHYWYRPPQLDRALFALASADCAKLHAATAQYVPIGDGNGEGSPEFLPDSILFNGAVECGHAKQDMGGLPWPAPKARGVATFGQDVEAGNWYAGVTLSARACDGDCSYETFSVEPKEENPEYRQFDPEVFSFCKTAFRPYDLMVQACLIALRHHLGPVFRVTSDGDESDWADARRLCRNVLGYGEAFRLATEEASAK